LGGRGFGAALLILGWGTPGGNPVQVTPQFLLRFVWDRVFPALVQEPGPD